MSNESKQMPAPEIIRQGHEPRDANVKGIALAALVLVLIGMVIHVALYFHFAANAKGFPVPHAVLAAERSDISPHRDLVSFEQQQQTELNTYGWISREQGVVRIPIEQAMKLLAERGLAVRSAPSKNEKSPLELQQERAKEK